MRTTATFLIGCVFGATAVLVYLEDTQQLAIAAQTAPVEPAAVIPASSDVLIIPVEGVRPEALHSTFMERRGSERFHHALDILAPRGTPVLAAVDGTIRKLFRSTAGGITIYEFDRSATRVYYYAHLDHYADGLREGMPVTRGQLIGYVGNTGNAQGGTPHLHFAVYILGPEKQWYRGTPIDPYPLLTGKSGGATAVHVSAMP